MKVFIDLIHYLTSSGMTIYDFAHMMIQEALKITKINATAGIGTNRHLAKIAMGVAAKHIPADEEGVRISQLDVMSYRCQLWNHQPIIDFWRVGHGCVKKLAEHGMFMMGDVARCSVGKPNQRYNEFYISCLESMQNCSLTIPRDGNSVLLLKSKHISMPPTLSDRVRFCTVLIPQKRLVY